MTRDDIIEMARESGFSLQVAYANLEEIERIAALVEAKAAASEREVCAKLCDERAGLWPDEGGTPEACASDIRARGQA